MKTLTVILLVFFATISEGFTQMNIYQNMQNANTHVYNSISPKANIPVNNSITPSVGNVSTSSVNTFQPVYYSPEDIMKMMDKVRNNTVEIKGLTDWIWNGEVPVNNDPAKGVRNNPTLQLQRSNTINNLNTNYNEFYKKHNN
jgi:hypothetical protein